MQTFLELQYLVEYLVDNLELSKFSNTSLCVKNYLMGIDGIRNSDMKKNIVKNKCCTEKDGHVLKKWRSTTSKEVKVKVSLV